MFPSSSEPPSLVLERMASIGTNQESARKHVCKELGRRGLRLSFFATAHGMMRLNEDEEMAIGWVRADGFEYIGRNCTWA